MYHPERMKETSFLSIVLPTNVDEWMHSNLVSVGLTPTMQFSQQSTSSLLKLLFMFSSNTLSASNFLNWDIFTDGPFARHFTTVPKFLNVYLY